MKPIQIAKLWRSRVHSLNILAWLMLLTIGLAKGQWTAAQLPPSGITSPRDNAVVAGAVSIQGTATHPDFWKYELYWSPMTNELWHLIGQVHKTPVINGQLGIWYTATVPDGAYKLRLRVVRKDGNYDEYFVRSISVSNTVPTATPTLKVTPTRTPIPTSLPPTSTIVVEQPSLPSPTPQATVSESASSGKKSQTRATPLPSSVPSSLSIEGLSNAACYGGASAGGLFLLVVILALLRRLVSLLLSRL
ncbi:MAG: hypothetical protein U9Q78_03350 [Chloroflexota bacterium]|nr:hypothetical protein [Chloroflexota bacterium]